MLRSNPSLLVLAVALSGLAGFVDALGFLEAGGFFISFMSGNSTRLAVGLAEGTSAALTAGGLIAGFLAGVTLGSITGHLAGPRRRPAVTGLVALLLLLAAIAAPWHIGVALGAMVLAMGAENAALADEGDVKVGLTYMTGALVRMGQGVANVLLRVKGAPVLPDFALWLGLVTGATLGALAHLALGNGALWIAAALAAALTLAAAKLRPAAPVRRS